MSVSATQSSQSTQASQSTGTQMVQYDAVRIQDRDQLLPVLRANDSFARANDSFARSQQPSIPRSIQLTRAEYFRWSPVYGCRVWGLCPSYESIRPSIRIGNVIEALFEEVEDLEYRQALFGVYLAQQLPLGGSRRRKYDQQFIINLAPITHSKISIFLQIKGYLNQLRTTIIDLSHPSDFRNSRDHFQFFLSKVTPRSRIYIIGSCHAGGSTVVNCDEQSRGLTVSAIARAFYLYAPIGGCSEPVRISVYSGASGLCRIMPNGQVEPSFCERLSWALGGYNIYAEVIGRTTDCSYNLAVREDHTLTKNYYYFRETTKVCCITRGQGFISTPYTVPPYVSDEEVRNGLPEGSCVIS